MGSYKKWRDMTDAEKESIREGQRQKADELWTRLEEGIREIYESDRYRDYLDLASKVYQYSANNQILILMQKPEASMVQCMKAWNRMEIRGKEYHRSVNKGEKGIRILVPLLKTVEMIDKNGNRVLDMNGDPVMKKLPYAFKIGNVFDISQTSGDELPDISDFCSVLTGDVPDFEVYREAVEAACPFMVSYEETASKDIKGYCDHGSCRVVVRPDLSEAQTLKTLIHETAHARFHDPKDKEDPIRRNDMEIQAESIAYIVSSHLGLDTSDYSFGYVAGWASGRKIDDLRTNMNAIQEGAEELIQGIRVAMELHRELDLVYGADLPKESAVLPDKPQVQNTLRGFKPAYKPGKPKCRRKERDEI